jgi:hypothetical protein
MHISPTEAEEALAAIQSMVRKTKRRISQSGAYAFLIVWGFVWMFGFLASHFVHNETIGYIWMGLDILGGNRDIRSPSAVASGRRIAWFWLLLFFYCIAAIGVAWPLDGQKLAMFILFFVMVGWMAMSLLLSFTSFWWGLVITAIALIGYFFLSDIFYLWMAILGGGGMIALGIYIRKRW